MFEGNFSSFAKHTKISPLTGFATHMFHERLKLVHSASSNMSLRSRSSWNNSQYANLWCYPQQEKIRRRAVL